MIARDRATDRDRLEAIHLVGKKYNFRIYELVIFCTLRWNTSWVGALMIRSWLLCHGGELLNNLVLNFGMAGHHVEKPAQSGGSGIPSSDDEIQNHVSQGRVRVHRSDLLLLVVA